MTLKVLAPSGHTVQVKVGPNDSVASVLEKSCAKRKLDPESHQLFHHNRKVDLSLTIRLANLPNFGQLELRESTGENPQLKTEEKVEVAIQLSDSGKRLQRKSFNPSDTLNKVYSDFRSEIGEAQSQESNLVFVYMQTSITAQNEEELKKTTLKSLGLVKGGGLLRFSYKATEALKDQAGSFDIKTKPVNTEEKPERTARPMRAVDDGRRILDALKTEHEEKRRRLEEEEDLKTPKDEERSEMEVEQNPTEKGSKVEEIEEVERPKKAEEPSEPEEEPVLNYLDEERRVVAFIPESKVKRVNVSDLDESFFELSVDEVKKLYAERVKEVKRLQEGDQLVTKSFKESRKEAEKMDLLSKYKRSVVRCQFPDRWTLQASFLSGENVWEIYELVRKFAETSNISSPDNIELFTAPPKTVLKPASTILDSGLVPSAVVYVGVKGHPEGGIPLSLKSEIKAEKASNLSGANKAAIESDCKRAVKQNSTNVNPVVTSTTKKKDGVPKWFKP